MLTKIIGVRNVARLRNYAASGDVEFRPLTLIFAENGRGKTTICDILRSLKTGESSWIQGRSTLGSKSKPEVDLLYDGQRVDYRNNAWGRSCPDIELFDSTFIHRNVYSGYSVEHNHKKNLYKDVILGEKGTTLAEVIDRLDGESRKAAGRKSAVKREIERLIPTGINFETFMELEHSPGINELITQAAKRTSALRRSEEIEKKGYLQELELPDLPVDFQRVLSLVIENLEDDAEVLVRDHLEKHTAGASESWIQSGLHYQKDGECPWCQQALDDVELFDAYRSYFSVAYRDLKDSIATCRNGVTAMSDQVTTLRFEKRILENAELHNFWSDFIPNFEVSIDQAAVNNALRTVSRAAESLLTKKQNAPLERIMIEQSFLDATAQFEQIKNEVEEYNRSVQEINAAIDDVKRNAASEDAAQAEARLQLLTGVKKRHEDEVKEMCAEYESAAADKARLADEKDEAKKALDEYSSSVMEEFETRINELLEMFGATFKIGGTCRQYLGGRASSDYGVVINGVLVDLGNADTSLSKPSFRNTLSEGDKRTLALAFFIARAEKDSNLESKVLIFDDPFNSQDGSRRTATQQLIRRFVDDARQVVVLCHEAFFLRGLWDRMEKAKVRTLFITRVGADDSAIRPWDIKADTARTEYEKHMNALKEYCYDGKGEPRDIASRIRLMLEEYYRFAWTDQFGTDEWLGDFIRKIRECVAGEPLLPLKRIHEELSHINDYSQKYHHARNSGAASEPINDAELNSYVRRSLKLVGVI